MRPTDPPAFAMTLLERSMPQRTSAGLIGDLVEEYRNGRSRVWFWQQTIIALLTCASREARRHKLQAISAILIGYICGASLMFFSTSAAAQFVHGYKSFVVFLPLAFLSAAASGRLVSQIHSKQMVLIFALFFYPASVVAFTVYALFPIERMGLPELLMHLAIDFIIAPLGILVGGFVAADRVRSPGTHRSM
jgi:hypothetical protein